MDSTLKPQEAEPDEAPAIAPDIVPAAWADKVLADITRDARSHSLDRMPDAESSADAGASEAAPAVDTTFRPTAIDKPPSRKWLTKTILAFMFALGGVAAAADWQHYGGVARQMISDWTPRFALMVSPPVAPAPVEPAEAPVVQATLADPAPAAPPAQPAEAAAPAIAAPLPDQAQLLQSMARDLAAMGQQVTQLRASIDQLKAGQQTLAADVARISEARTSEIKTPETRAPEIRTPAARAVETRPAEIRAPAAPPRPKVTAMVTPPRPAAAPLRKPVPAYPSAQAAAAPLPLVPAPPPAQTTAQPDGEPVVRPPMPLR